MISLNFKKEVPFDVSEAETVKDRKPYLIDTYGSRLLVNCYDSVLLDAKALTLK